MQMLVPHVCPHCGQTHDVKCGLEFEPHPGMDEPRFVWRVIDDWDCNCPIPHGDIPDALYSDMVRITPDNQHLIRR